MQVKRVKRSVTIPTGFEIAIDGTREFTGMDALDWAKRAVDLGAGELCVNSIDQDGTHAGFDIELMDAICDSVNVPVIASGGAGTPRHVADVLKTGASAAIVSSMLYSPHLPRNFPCAEIKEFLIKEGIHVRPDFEISPAQN